MFPPNRPYVRRREKIMVPASLTAVLLTTLLVAGCSPTGAADGAPPQPTPTGSPHANEPDLDSPCALVDATTLDALIGEAPAGVEIVVPGTDLPACQFGDITSSGVQVAQVPAEEWARSLPDIVDTLLSLPSGAVDPKMLQQLEEASGHVAAGATVAPDEACSYFSQLLEISGQEPGTEVSVSYLPDLASAVAVSGQQCSAGTYTSLLVGRADLSDDPQIVGLVMGVLEELG